MSIEETRQLGIEFERRIQTMMPEKEFISKLDTETIYSFLNQYQDKFVHELYRSLDLIQGDTKISARMEVILQDLLKKQDIVLNDSDRKPGHIVVDLSEDFGLYLRSTSKVSSTYLFKEYTEGESFDEPGYIPNKLMSQTEASKIIETPRNQFRILKYPVAVLSKYVLVDGERFPSDFPYQFGGNAPTLTVIHDRYTNIESIHVLYYKMPAHFSTLTNTPCELSVDVFDDLVSGAINLYIQYVAGTEANKKLLQEAAKSNAEKNND